CYSATTPLFIDSRFGELLENPPKEASLLLPKGEEVLKQCRAFQGLPYIWGGNYSAGIPEMKAFYPPPEEKSLSSIEEKRWILQGIDCSGLLYEATGGITPRNTKELLFFGKSVFIQGKKGKEILKLLAPLDLIVWKGHVLIVLSDKEWIESRHSKGGVVIISSEERLFEILEKEKKIPVDDPAKAKQDSSLFVVRRWRAG
ncbi:MAG: C40 family peptidase, partial [Simkania negevensis]|nr:C40 family peptidase [Simkania negevensis]